ncbi:membrane protein [Paenibacillus sp. CCS19]|uniref:divergent PAP2 family protein n=1 Tax=Paenibacillus sp. CCS19 TaxID=3158387 RepID=UPI00256D5C1D|nr:divergent PAP2 family protein [Paenibacillus cellulosilyticus]GMK38396.1 membrane protein [Paenibacillus cellulosilyticus]
MYFIAPFIAWLVAGSMKYAVNQIRYGNAKERIGNGGFPSNHTTIVTTTIMLIGWKEGFASPIFGLGTAILFIVIIDATGLRRYVGMHARHLNEMRPDGSRLRESVGHNAVEIGGGLVLGALLGYALSWIA